MRFSTVDRCFWCIGLRTSGIIMGVLGVLSSASYIIIGFPEPMWALMLCYFGLIVSSAFLYGIFNERPHSMLPMIIVTFVSVPVLFLMPISFVTYYFVTKTHIEKEDNYRAFICLTASNCVYCLGAFNYYLWNVQYSLYIVIKETAAEIGNQGRYGV